MKLNTAETISKLREGWVLSEQGVLFHPERRTQGAHQVRTDALRSLKRRGIIAPTDESRFWWTLTEEST